MGCTRALPNLCRNGTDGLERTTFGAGVDNGSLSLEGGGCRPPADDSAAVDGWRLSNATRGVDRKGTAAAAAAAIVLSDASISSALSHVDAIVVTSRIHHQDTREKVRPFKTLSALANLKTLPATKGVEITSISNA